jgi:hypothetical protein
MGTENTITTLSVEPVFGPLSEVPPPPATGPPPVPAGEDEGGMLDVGVGETEISR